MTETTTETQAARVKGSVKNVQTERGYMFVTEQATGIDYFVHHSLIEMTSDVAWGDIKRGQRVTFIPCEGGPKGPRAIEVRVYES